MSSPFGKYAAIVAAVAAVLVIGTWLATVVLPGVPKSDALDTVAIATFGVIFGTGVGATVVSNGLGSKLDAANARLDAVGAPSAAAAATQEAGPAADSAEPATMTDPGA